MEDTCPICSKENNCNAANCGFGYGSCWCYEEDIPDGLLKYLQGKPCVCRTCVEKYNHGYLTDIHLFMKFRTSHEVKV